MRYGFVLDQRKCIGCHACTVACKAENQVPLGSFRTWVKYVEKGEYPSTRRHFAVMRCNHCDNAPCVRICPTQALFTRPDGIVDLDGEKCIGCGSCMQACPYDALYFHPDKGVAEKCHYCAHRVEKGLEPACVIVCPVQAIVTGDLDNPQSQIAQLVSTLPTLTRKPEQGTRPKVFYLGADAEAIAPGAGHTDIPASYLWAEGPAEILQMLADPSTLPETREVYNVSHARPWGWHIAAYLWTKSIAAGAAMVGAVGLLAGSDNPLLARTAPLLSLFFLAVTAVLLVADLKRPERFWRLLLRPNLRSWLVWGGYIITLFGALTALWWWMDSRPAVLLGACAALGAATAGYSAFLFAQAEGRDFWQSPLVMPHLVVQAVLAGAAAFLILGHLTGAELPDGLDLWLAGALGLHLLMVFAEVAVPHANRDSALAARHITRDNKGLLWGLVIGGGGVAPLLAIALVGDAALGLAAAASLVGLLAYEQLWVSAGQSVALS